MNAAERLEACRSCPIKVIALNSVWCGTPVIGNNVMHGGKVIKQCGCKMEFAVKVKQKRCPIKRWNNADDRNK